MSGQIGSWNIEPASIGGDGNPLWYYIIDRENKIVATTWSGSNNQFKHARLISAAPDMLQLLRVCSAGFNAEEFTDQNKRDAKNLIDAMIAFAEGGAQ